MDEMKTWDQRILERIDSGVDPTLIDENLRRTPTDRLESMRQVLLSLEGARNSHDHGLRSPDRRPVR